MTAGGGVAALSLPDLYPLLDWIETTALAGLLRNSGVWTYGLINLAHILGISTLFGAVLVLDLRLLGLWRGLSIAALARPTVPLAALGFVVAVLSGVAMLSFNATEYWGNPFLYLKLPLIAFGLLNVAVVQRLGAWRRAVAGDALAASDGAVLALAGAISLATWLAVVSCGRMIGYW